jgi:hypothetical protein
MGVEEKLENCGWHRDVLFTKSFASGTILACMVCIYPVGGGVGCNFQRSDWGQGHLFCRWWCSQQVALQKHAWYHLPDWCCPLFPNFTSSAFQLSIAHSNYQCSSNSEPVKNINFQQLAVSTLRLSWSLSHQAVNRFRLVEGMHFFSSCYYWLALGPFALPCAHVCSYLPSPEEGWVGLGTLHCFSWMHMILLAFLSVLPPLLCVMRLYISLSHLYIISV